MEKRVLYLFPANPFDKYRIREFGDLLSKGEQGDKKVMRKNT